MPAKNKNITELLQLFLQIPDQNTAEDFFEDLFTPQELEALAERWQIVKMLMETDCPQREIAKKLGCSVALVTRANRMLKYGNGGFKKIYTQIKTKKSEEKNQKNS